MSEATLWADMYRHECTRSERWFNEYIKLQMTRNDAALRAQDLERRLAEAEARLNEVLARMQREVEA